MASASGGTVCTRCLSKKHKGICLRCAPDYVPGGLSPSTAVAPEIHALADREPPTVKASEDMISAMRHLLGPGTAYMSKNNGDEVILPAGLILFHGTLAQFDPRDLKPWSWFTTHMNSPVSMIGEHWGSCGATIPWAQCNPRVYELALTRQLRLKLFNAKGWDASLRVHGPLENSEGAASQSIISEGFDGSISPYFEEEMRIGMEGKKFIRVVREHPIDRGVFAFNRKIGSKKSNLIGQTGIIGKDEKPPRIYDSGWIPPQLIQAVEQSVGALQVVTFDNRLLAYSLMRQSEAAGSANARDAVVGYIFNGVGYSDHNYHMLVIWDPIKRHRIFDATAPLVPGGTAPPNVNKNVISDKSAKEAAPATNGIRDEIYREALAVAGWNASGLTNTHGPVSVSLWGLGRMGETEAHKQAERALFDAFSSFVEFYSRKQPLGPFQVKGRAVPINYLMEQPQHRQFVRRVSGDVLREKDKWGVRYDRQTEFLRVMSNMRFTDDDPIADTQVAMLRGLWAPLQLALSGISNTYAKEQALRGIMDQKAFDPARNKGFNITKWSIHLDLPAITEEIVKLQVQLGNVSTTSTLHSKILERVVESGARRCAERWLFDENSATQFSKLARRSPTSKGIQDVPISTRRQWAAKIAEKYDRFFDVGHVADQAAALKLALDKLLAAPVVKEKLPVSVMAEMVRKKTPGYVEQLAAVKEIEFDPSNASFGADAFEVLAYMHMHGTIQTNAGEKRQAALYRAYRPLFEHWDKLLAAAITGPASSLMATSVEKRKELLEAIRYAITGKTRTVGSKLAAVLARTFAMPGVVFGMELQCELWLPTIFQHVAVDIGAYAEEKEISPGVHEAPAEALNIFLAFAINIARGGAGPAAEKLFLSLLRLHPKPLEELLQSRANKNAPLAHARLAASVPAVQHQGIILKVLRVAKQRLEYRISVAIYDGNFGHAAKFHQKEHEDLWAEGIWHASTPKIRHTEIGLTTAKKKYGLPKKLLEEKIFEERGTKKTTYVWEELCAFAANFYHSSDDILKQLEKHAEDVKKKKEGDKKKAEEKKRKKLEAEAAAAAGTSVPLLPSSDAPPPPPVVCAVKTDEFGDPEDNAGPEPDEDAEVQELNEIALEVSIASAPPLTGGNAAASASGNAPACRPCPECHCANYPDCELGRKGDEEACEVCIDTVTGDHKPYFCPDDEAEESSPKKKKKEKKTLPAPMIISAGLGAGIGITLGPFGIAAGAAAGAGAGPAYPVERESSPAVYNPDQGPPPLPTDVTYSDEELPETEDARARAYIKGGHRGSLTEWAHRRSHSHHHRLTHADKVAATHSRDSQTRLEGKFALNAERVAHGQHIGDELDGESSGSESDAYSSEEDAPEVGAIGKPIGPLNPKHKGQFTRWAQRHHYKSMSAAEHAGERAENAHVRKMAQFAENASHWHHGDHS